VRDAALGFLRAVQADQGISGVFNIAYDNFTVGQVADTVKDEVEGLADRRVHITVHDIRDYRNYKVACEKAKTYLGFAPKYGIADTVRDLYQHRSAYGDFSNDAFYNIETFKKLERRG